MTDPTDDELERAERIRKLRSGGARSRSQEVRDQRREGDDAGPPADEDARERTAGDDDTGSSGTGSNVAEEDSVDDALSEADRADVMAMTEALPEDGSLFVLPVRTEVRRAFNRMAEQLRLEYGFEYDADLDRETHLRPLALYLGILTLEDADAEAVRDLLHSIDGLEAPGESGDEE